MASSSSAGRQRREHVRPGADVLADRRVLERTVEQVGAHGGDEPDVGRLVVDRRRDDVEEGVAPLGAARASSTPRTGRRRRPPVRAGRRRRPATSTARRRRRRQPTPWRPRSAPRAAPPSGSSPGTIVTTTSPPVAQPGDEPGADHRALPEPDDADDGDQRSERRPASSELGRRRSSRPWKRRRVGLVERAQSAVRVDPGRVARASCRAARAGAESTCATVARTRRRSAARRAADGGPPRQHELGDRRVAALDRPAAGHGVETVGDRRHPADEARHGPAGERRRRPSDGHRRGGRAPVSSSQTIQPRSRTSPSRDPLAGPRSSPMTAMPKSVR